LHCLSAYFFICLRQVVQLYIFIFAKVRRKVLSQNQTAHCPLCAKSDKKQQNHCHQEGSCKDVVIAAQKVDEFNRLSQTLNFNSFSPAIVTLHWIYNYYQFPTDEDNPSKLSANQNTVIKRYSPAVFILNQSFRI